jgi:hypothetical protein
MADDVTSDEALKLHNITWMETEVELIKYLRYRI